jgi:hypothetical protein
LKAEVTFGEQVGKTAVLPVPIIGIRKNLCRWAAEMETKHEEKIALSVHGIDPYLIRYAYGLFHKHRRGR